MLIISISTFISFKSARCDTYMPKVKKKAIRKAQYDRKQTILDPTRTTGLKERKPDAQFFYTSPEAKFMCPFCLYIGMLWRFSVKTKKGYSDKRAKCPECGEGMLMRTLRMKVTPEEFADWCYDYGKGFWSKVGNFKQWNERLRKIGWSWEFWAKYKALKGEEPQESYSDYMNRQAQEYYEKHKNEKI